MRRPETFDPPIRIQWALSPGAHESKASPSRRLISFGSMTSSATPLMITLQPARACPSMPSISNVASAYRTRAWNPEPTAVRNTTDRDRSSNR